MAEPFNLQKEKAKARIRLRQRGQQATREATGIPTGITAIKSLFDKSISRVSTADPISFEELKRRAQLPQPQAQPPEDVGATIGEGVGQVVGSFIAPGPGTFIGGILGAGAGQSIEDFILKGEVKPARTATEMGLSAVPEVVESVVKTFGRRAALGVMKRTPGGKLIRFEMAADQARKNLPAVFDPPQKEAASALFKAMDDAGINVDLSEFGTLLRAFPKPIFGELTLELARIDRKLKTGGKFRKALRRARKGEKTSELDLGDLQTLRSELRQRADELGPIQAKQLLKDLQDDVDELIDTALANQGAAVGLPGDLARDARKQWARFRAAENMSFMLEQSITSTPDLRLQTFNLRQFFDTLRKNNTTLAKNTNSALDITPGARESFIREINEISTIMNTIEFPLTDVAGFRRNAIVAGLGQMLSTVLLTDTGRRMFKEALIEDRGRLSMNTVALISNAVRREISGSGANPLTEDVRRRTRPLLPIQPPVATSP